jgi:hypothetical protein
VVIDGPTPSALAQILPLLLLTLILEMRRTALHRKVSRTWFGGDRDGELYPFQWGDLLSAITIFGLLAMILAISFIEPRDS